MSNVAEATIADTGEKDRRGTRVKYQVEFYMSPKYFAELEHQAKSMGYTTDQYVSTVIGRASWHDAEERWERYIDREPVEDWLARQ